MKNKILFVLAFFQIMFVFAQGNSATDTSFTGINESFTKNNGNIHHDSLQIICSPNPMTHITKLSFDLPCTDSIVSVEIYDDSGIYINTLFEGSAKKGKIDTQWDGKNSFGEKVSNGIYYCEISSAGFSKSIKLIYTE
jgi:flagellar hook assembly protein FlgD